MTERAAAAARGLGHVAPGKPIKLVIWDLDDTIWHGTLLEGGAGAAIEGVAETIERLDARGILHSIASRNDAELATRTLRDMGLMDYFLCPQIGWGAKSEAVRRIADRLGLGLDSVLFVDDQAFEREEVAAALPAVRTLPAALAPGLPEEPLLTAPAVTREARRRRLAYREEAARDDFERGFEGPSEAFLHSLQLRLSVAPAAPDDLLRAEELVLRTNQLNSTGTIYTFDDLERLRAAGDHRLLMAALSDRFGDYGTIGLILIGTSPALWRLKLLIVSCRVLSRGVGGVLLHHVMREAKRAGAAFEAEFRPTGRNRPMHIAYRFSGLREIRREGEVRIYSRQLHDLPGLPAHYRLIDGDGRHDGEDKESRSG